MTSPTDTAGHPDVSELSDLTEGILPLSRSTAVRRHLEGCEPCTDTLASLEEIRALLGSEPDTPRMPDEVTARIDAALAAEALLASLPRGNTATADSTHAIPAGGDTATPVSRETASVSRETSTPSTRPSSRPSAATGPGRKERDQRERGHKERDRSRRRNFALGAVLTAVVVGGGSLLFQSLAGHDSADTMAGGKVAPSAGAFSGDSVQSQVESLLTAKKGLQRGTQRSQENGEAAVPTQPTQSANTLIQTEVPVPDCVRRALNSRQDVLAAKTGTYGGRNAYLVVLPDANDSTRVTAYVVDASCTMHRPMSPGDVLLKQSLSRN